MGEYDVAQVCRNGHTITSMAQTVPQHRREFCPECGAPTLTACEHCGVPIRGEYHVTGYFGPSEFEVPKYCHDCGKPYPWQAFGAARYAT